MFSLSNPSYPDLVVESPSGVASLHLNPLHPHMLALGLQVMSVSVCVLMRIATLYCALPLLLLVKTPQRSNQHFGFNHAKKTVSFDNDIHVYSEGRECGRVQPGEEGQGASVSLRSSGGQTQGDSLAGEH